jgi:uncharacterized protein DUF6178
MPKSVRRDQRRDTRALQETRDERRLLDRILDTPNLERVVPQLHPEVLHRVIQTCGLEDCGEIVALATPEQLAQVFDLDLWRAHQPGLDEQLDADRFGVWLEVLVECGADVAAQQLVKMDVDLVAAALAQHARVSDRGVFEPTAPSDDEEPVARRRDDGLSCEIGGQLIVARRTDSWDAIIAVLVALDAEHPDCFRRVMSGCRHLSNSAPEIDGLDDLLAVDEQVMFDLTVDREKRREKQGYATPAQARAFLKMSRELRLGHDTAPPGNPVARAYFRAIEPTAAEDADNGPRGLLPSSEAPPAPEDSVEAAAAIVDVLVDAGVLPRPPRALLDRPQGPATRLARIRAQMQFARDRDAAAFSLRSEELAYLANAIVEGCSVQARPFTAQEASDAAAAVCNLGLENYPVHWLQAKALSDDFLVNHDLVSVFQVGWTVLHDDVCMYAAQELIAVLTRVRCDDHETQVGLDALRADMTTQWRAGTPWRARDALDVIASLDMPAWAALLGVIDECPVLHAAIAAARDPRIRAVGAAAFEFISENSQIASVREFMRSLPETLRP